MKVNSGWFSGRLVRDPEIHTTGTGSTVCNITLAQDDDYRDRNGVEKGATIFLDVAIWGERGVAFAKYHKKGDMALVEFRLRMDEWNDRTTGARQTKLKANAKDWQFASVRRDEAPM